MPIKKLIFAAMLAASALIIQPAVAVAADLPDFTRIVETEGRAVVNVSTTSTIKQNLSTLPEGMEGDPFFEFFRRFAPQQQQERQERSLGSGFIISADGYILTNAHVVARADEITVTLTDKREFKAKVIGSDARTDVALLKINAKELPVVRLGNMADVKVGEWVLAIGSPFGFENTVTSGIVSAKNRLLPDENFVPFLQTDAAVNPGNSGGPLFNMKGEVIGINSQIYSRSGGFMGISFSIPIDVAMNIADQLKRTGKISRGRIGVAIQELNAELASSFGLAKPVGALVNQVEKGGPADKAGLKSGDIILAVADQPVGSSSDLPRLIGAARPGQPIQLEVWRNRAGLKLTVVPEELKSEDARTQQREYRGPQAVQEGQNLKPFGLVVSELNAQQLSQAGIKYGLQVRKATGLAARAGLQAGDVIVGLGGESISSFAQFKSQLGKAAKGSALALQVMRQGVTLFIPLTVSEEE